MDIPRSEEISPEENKILLVHKFKESPDPI